MEINNPRNNLIPVYNFTVYVGFIKLNFTKITGIKGAVNVETVAEGGLNDRVHYFYGPQKETNRLVLERGLYKLPFGEAVMNAGSIFLGDMIIFMLNDYGLPVRSFAVENPVLESWELSDLNATSGEIIIHKATVIHHGITEINFRANLHMEQFEFK